MDTASGLPSLQVLRDISNDKSASRSRIGNAVTDLYLSDGSNLGDQELSLIHDILRLVVHNVEIGLRRRLAEVMVNDPSIPRDIVLLLANDTAEVAWPILVASPQLLDKDLTDVIRTRGREHQLAIAARKQLSPSVSAALVETKYEGVISALLENHDAEISRATFDHLVYESKRIDQFQRPLIMRADIPEDLLLRMCGWVGANLRQQVMTRLHLPAETVDVALQQIMAEGFRSGHTPTQRLAAQLTEKSHITPALLVNLLNDGQISLFATLAARLAGIDRNAVIDALVDNGGEPQALLCRALDFAEGDFSSLLDVCGRLIGGGQKVVFRLDRLHALYPRLTLTGARRAFGAWREGLPVAAAIREAEVI